MATERQSTRSCAGQVPSAHQTGLGWLFSRPPGREEWTFFPATLDVRTAIFAPPPHPRNQRADLDPTGSARATLLTTIPCSPCSCIPFRPRFGAWGRRRNTGEEQWPGLPGKPAPSAPGLSCFSLRPLSHCLARQPARASKRFRSLRSYFDVLDQRHDSRVPSTVVCLSVESWFHGSASNVTR